MFNSNPSSQNSEWLGDQSNSKIKESREELGKKLHLSHQNDKRFQWIIKDKKWNPLADWKCKRWNEKMVPIWRRTTVADWRIARSVTIWERRMLLRKLLHNLTGERSRLLVTIHFTLHSMQSHVTWQIWCMTYIIVSHLYEKTETMTNLHRSWMFCMKLKMWFRHKTLFFLEGEIMPQSMTYLGHRSLRWKLKEKNEWTVLTSKSNSLSLPISKANFTHQTLNPPENSTSVSKPFLHNMHSPKRKSSKFALFCQITGSICYRFPHPLIFHNSSAVSENASQADVLFSVLFTNLSIICFFIQDS